MKTSGTWAVVLTFTALILGVLLLAQQREAKAVMLNAQQGYSLMTTGVPGGDEVLTVVDKSTEKMVTYRMQGNTMELMSGMAFGPKFR